MRPSVGLGRAADNSLTRPKRGVIVGADIGGHHVAAAAVDPTAPGRLLPDSYTHRIVAPDADRDTLISAWAEVIDGVIAFAGPDRVAGVGIAMPGPFDYRTGVGWFERNAKFASLHGVDVAAALAGCARHPRPLRFLNDATSFTVGSVAMTPSPRWGRILGLTLGTGLGSAFLADGVPVIAGSEVPDHGCVWHLPFRQGIADDYVSSRWLLSEAATRLGQSFAGVAPLAHMARAGNAPAAAIFADYGASLATVVAPFVDSFRVDAIFLGGRICGAFDLFEPALQTTLAAHGRLPTIGRRQNTEDAAIIGAARTFDPSFWDRARHNLPLR